MSTPLPGRRLSELDFADSPIGAEIYGNKDGLPVRIKVGDALGLLALDDAGMVPPEQIPGGAATLREDLMETADAAKGAAMVGFLPAGAGAVARTALAKMREVISVEDFGAVGDGVADDTDAFKRARDYAVTIGGAVIELRSRKYKLTDTITVATPHILFKGGGLWINHDVGVNNPKTWLDWQGVLGGTMFQFAPTEGVAQQRGTGGGLIDVGMYGNNLAGNGLVVKSWTNGDFRVFGANFNRTIVEVGVVTTLGEARDAQFNNFWIYGRQVTALGSPSTLIIGGSHNGANVANTSFNRFNEISTNYKNGVALDLYDSDSNWFGLVRLNSGGGTGKGMVWHGGTGVTGANKDAARGNYFQMLSAGAGGLHANGTDVDAAAANGTVAWWDGGNGAPNPSIGTGALISWGLGGHIHTGQSFNKVAIADTVALATSEKSAMGTETVRIRNSSNNHARLTDGVNEWGVAISGGNLLITRHAGTGMILTAANMQMGAPGFYGTAPISKGVVSGSRGGNAALTSLLTALANVGLITNSSTT